MNYKESSNVETDRQAQLKRDVQEAIAEIERGDFMSIDEAFEKAAEKIKNKFSQNVQKQYEFNISTTREDI